MFFFIHGWASTPMVWAGLTDRKDCYFYDSSTYPNYQELSKIFIDVADKTDSPHILVGWSLGGMLALQLAFDFPGKIDKLILISSTAKFTADDSYTAGIHPSIVKNLARKINSDSVAAQKNFYKLMFSKQEDHACNEFLDESAEKIVTKNILSLKNGLQYLLDTDLRNLLSSINVQTNIIHGTDDSICPFSAAQYLANHIAESTLSVIQGAGHIPFYTQKEVCKNLIFNM